MKIVILFYCREQENKQLMDKYAKTTDSLQLINENVKNKGNVSNHNTFFFNL